MSKTELNEEARQGTPGEAAWNAYHGEHGHREYRVQLTLPTNPGKGK